MKFKTQFAGLKKCNLHRYLIPVIFMHINMVAIGNDSINVDTFAIYLNKSIESRNKDQIKESTKYLLEGKKYCKTKFQYATIFNSLGRNYFEISDYHTAINYYNSAFSLTDSIKNPLFTGYLYDNYGLCYAQLLEFEKAIQFYHKAALLLDNESIGILYFNISKCYGYLGKKDSTFYYLNKSYRNNVKALGEDSYYTMLTELEIAEINEKVSANLKERVLKSSDNLLKGKYYTIINNFKQGERYLPANSKSLLKLYIKFKKWDKAISVIDSLRNSFLSVDSKLFLQANERLIYKNAIDEFIRTDTAKALKTALKSHANVLKENISYTLHEFPKNSYNYFDFDSVIYLFLVEEKISYYRIETDSVFQKKYDQFISVFNLKWILDDFMSNYQTYVESAYYLYTKLVPKTRKNMLIIPEGRLLYLPFEALLTEVPAPAPYPVYKGLPYLMNGTNIWYDFLLREYKKPKGKKSITALAPDKSLGYALKEVKNLWRFKSKRLTGKRARLECIKNNEILHIASHFNPDNNTLVFADTLLNIEGLKLLPKDLTVLSTCYSGSGKLYKGEGNFSAGRAFYAAGSESIIESLWSNDDRSSYIIFSYFYNFLSKGGPKSKALSLAKHQFLIKCPHFVSHPYFWANLRFLGNDHPLKIPKNRNWIYSLLLFFAGIMIVKYILGIKRK